MVYGAESKDPGDACWQVLFGEFQPQTTREIKKVTASERSRGSAVPRTTTLNAEHGAQTELSSRLSRAAVGPERSAVRDLPLGRPCEACSGLANERTQTNLLCNLTPPSSLTASSASNGLTSPAGDETVLRSSASVSLCEANSTAACVPSVVKPLNISVRLPYWTPA